MHQGRGGTTEQRVKRGEREWHGCTTHTHAHVHAHVHAHTEKFIPENRGCVSTSMAAGRSMHSPPPELTDAGRRGGQPLHARCHRNALSLKHRLIITDARPFSLSLPLLGRHLYTPLGLSRWGTRRLLQPTLRFSPRFPPFLVCSLVLSSLRLSFSLVLTSLFRQRARCPRFSFCLTCLRVAVACVMTGLVGTARRVLSPFRRHSRAPTITGPRAEQLVGYILNSATPA